jgi:hypothetical protein
MPSPLSLSNFVNRLSRSLSTLQILPRRITSNNTLKNRKATKIQRTYRAHAMRRKLEAEKLEKQAMHLFRNNKAVIAQAVEAINKMARDVDDDRINTMVYHLWHDLSNKKRAKWIDKAREKLTQRDKSTTIKPVSE